MEVKQVIICDKCLTTHPDNDETIIGDICENCEESTMQRGTLFLAGTDEQTEILNDMVTSKIRTAMNDAEHDQLVIEDGDPCPKCGKRITVTGIDGEDDPLEIFCENCGWELQL